ncbi:MAG: DUF4365 domain-containing protein [Candidatus Bathyarchaeia archaeon]
MLDIPIRKEELSRSYLNAVCAYKGISVTRPEHDYDSVDVIMRATLTRDNNPFVTQINVQLKATSQELGQDVTGFNFELPMKNFNDLRRGSANPMMLCVLRLPAEEGQWVTHSINELILRNCMYWLDVTTCPSSNNTATVTVRIPWANTLTPEKALELMTKVAETGFL